MRIQAKPNMENAAKHIRDLTDAPAALAIEWLSIDRFDLPQDLEDAFAKEEEQVAEYGDHMLAEQLDEGTVPIPHLDSQLVKKILQHPECIQSLHIKIDRKNKGIFPAEGHIVLSQDEVAICNADYDPSDTEAIGMIHKALAMYEIIPSKDLDLAKGLQEELDRAQIEIFKAGEEIQKWKNQEQKLKEALKRLEAER